MAEEKTAQDSEIKQSAAQPQDKPSRTVWTWTVVGGCVLAIVAWLAMMKSPQVSFCCALVGGICSFMGALKLGKGLWRDVAITCVIACGVLLIVYGIFYVAVYYLINSL